MPFLHRGIFPRHLIIERSGSCQLGAHQTHPAAGSRQGLGEERFHTRGLPGEGHLPGQRHVGAELPRLVPQPPPLQLGGELLPQGEKLRAGLRPQPPQAALLGNCPIWENRSASRRGERASRAAVASSRRAGGTSPRKAKVRWRFPSAGHRAVGAVCRSRCWTWAMACLVAGEKPKAKKSLTAAPGSTGPLESPPAPAPPPGGWAA